MSKRSNWFNTLLYGCLCLGSVSAALAQLSATTSNGVAVYDCPGLDITLHGRTGNVKIIVEITDMFGYYGNETRNYATWSSDTLQLNTEGTANSTQSSIWSAHIFEGGANYGQQTTTYNIKVTVYEWNTSNVIDREIA